MIRSSLDKGAEPTLETSVCTSTTRNIPKQWMMQCVSSITVQSSVTVTGSTGGWGVPVREAAVLGAAK
jgi:hypothetical protein